MSVNRNTAILFFYKLRELIVHIPAVAARDLMAGEIELDENYFDGVRKGGRYFIHWFAVIPREISYEDDHQMTFH